LTIVRTLLDVNRGLKEPGQNRIEDGERKRPKGVIEKFGDRGRDGGRED
jgi:hypothetical protein